VRPNPVQGRNLYHRDYFPLWAAVEQLDKPACLHDSGSPHLPSYGDRMDTHTTGHIIAHPFEAMVAMMSLIWYGVFEHFPRLTVVHVEADAGWLPYWLQRMEQHYEFSSNAEHPDLKMHYPHPDGTWPWGMQRLHEQAIPEASKRKILWDNAARAFRLDA